MHQLKRCKLRTPIGLKSLPQLSISKSDQSDPRRSIPPYLSLPKHAEEGSINVRSLFEGEVLPELCARLTEEARSGSERLQGLAILLGVCLEIGVDARSPVLARLRGECLAHLSDTADVGVASLCHLGEVAYALEGEGSEVVERVVRSVAECVASGLTPGDAARVYSFLSHCHVRHSPSQALALARLHQQTEGLIHRLEAGHIKGILASLVVLQQGDAISLVLKLSHRASTVLESFTEQELLTVLSSLMFLGHHDEKLLVAMETHLPGRVGEADPELMATVMEYCLQTRCRSEPLFETAAQAFICHADKHSASQIARQIVAMGRLNYLPQCSGPLFRKLEDVLLARFSEFPPRSLVEVLHACLHLERFPLNFVSKVFSPFFLQRLQVHGEPFDRNVQSQLTQLNLCLSLECPSYRGPRLPYFLHAKKFSSADHCFEAPMESYLFNQIRGPLSALLGGKFYSTRVSTPAGYTVDVEFCVDEDGLVLPMAQWENTYRRIALCVDGQDRFCSNSQQLLGKEATKRRHLSRLGYTVVQIPYIEFEKLRSRKERLRYLGEKIFPSSFKANR
ncbi:FAST kinase domain-containing protein 3, mitochondrial-like [Aplochiton taeniatus]